MLTAVGLTAVDLVLVPVVIVHVLSCLTLILLILLHSGRGGGLSDMFGGGVGAAAAGSTVVERNLDRLTVAGALVFAYPSLYEGFGFPALEAQACGTPLLTSTTSSLPEVAGQGALLVDPQDTAALAQGLRRLLEDSELRRRLVACGYENLARFSWQRAATQVRDIIDALAGP